MGHVATAPTPFAQWLRNQLRERDWGVRTLARKMNPEEPEVARRALNRYLTGASPTAAYRNLIARGLGIDVSEVPDPDRQEVGPEADPFRRAGDGNPGGRPPVGGDGESAGDPPDPRDGYPDQVRERGDKRLLDAIRSAGEDAA